MRNVKISIILIALIFSVLVNADCNDDTSNELYDDNCAFDTNVVGWVDAITVGSMIHDSEDFQNSVSSGSALISSSSSMPANAIMSRCLPMSTPNLMNSGAWVKYNSGSEPNCRLLIGYYPDSSCAGAVISQGAGVELLINAAGGWTHLSGYSYGNDLNVNSVIFSMFCNSSDSFAMKADNFYVVPAPGLPVELQEFSID